jgi:hypothetical protein
VLQGTVNLHNTRFILRFHCSTIEYRRPGLLYQATACWDFSLLRLDLVLEGSGGNLMFCSQMISQVTLQKKIKIKKGLANTPTNNQGSKIFFTIYLRMPQNLNWMGRGYLNALL